jgi:hypothetical protein
MLDRHILKTNYGVSYGSVTLKSLQNDNIPELDLLVRESIQNSSDAALSMPGQSYCVNFTTGSFSPRDFNEFLTDIEPELNQRYPALSADFLEIRDTGTSGLTGCVKKSELKSEDHGNFFKLIYDTGKRQTQANAGGNWGFGKSVYYRVGIGIVIFYSRIKTDSGYESRLIITLVEDEGKKNPDGTDATILNKIEPLSAGKAWWGIRQGDDLLPLNDEEFINAVLNVFHLSPFSGDKTGTSIIIPYVDSQKLLSDIIPAEADIRDDVKEAFTSVWRQTIADYLKLSIQKWYAPKLHNLHLKTISGKKWLLASVNNVPIKKTDMLPFFRLVQELYNTAIAKTYGKEYSSDLFTEIKCEPVNVRNYFDSMTTGYLAVIKVGVDELNGGQNVLSPYDYIGHYEADGGLNEPIVMCTRDPGMVIDYPITGPWVKGISPPEDPNTFLFAFYMPIIEKRIKSDLNVPEYAGMEFGEYLRRCEASDHMGWDDPAKMQLVARIQKNSVRIINEQASGESRQKIEATASKLANKLGKKLLPRVGYGKKRIGGGSGGSGGSGGGRIINATLEFTDQRMYGNRMEMDFSFRLMHSKKNAEISLLIASEGGGWITPKSWQEDIGTSFPVAIEKVSISSIVYGQDTPVAAGESECTPACPSIATEAVSVSISRAEGSKEYSSICIDASVFNVRITGTLTVFAADKKYQFSVKVD